MMYQDIYNCICQNTKKWRYIIQYVKPTAQLVFSKRWTNMQEASGLSTTPNVARTISYKAWNSPAEYPHWVGVRWHHVESDTLKEGPGTETSWEVRDCRTPTTMAAVSHMTLSNAFPWMKMLKFRLEFHWSLFIRVQLTIFQHWFR